MAVLVLVLVVDKENEAGFLVETVNLPGYTEQQAGVAAGVTIFTGLVQSTFSILSRI